MKRLNAFIRKLRRADDGKKRRWFIGSAVVSIACVLLIWGWYVSAFVAGGGSPEAPQGNATPTGETVGFWETMQSGWEAVRGGVTEQFENQENSFGGAIGGIAEKANETRDILIETPESNFYFTEGEERPTATLPIAPRKK